MLRLPLTGPPLGVPFTVNRASPQAVGLVGWWPTVGQSGNLLDLTGRGWTMSAPSSGATPSRVATDTFGEARSFDGGDELNCATAVVSGEPFTVTCWFKTAVTSGVQTLASLSNGSNQFYRLFLFDANVGAQSQGTGAYTRTTASFAANTWSLAVGVWAATNSRAAYVNGGNPVAETTNTGATVTQTDIGVNRGNGAAYERFTGSLADVRIYNRALSDAEIWTLWAPQTRWDLYLVTPFAVAPSIAAPVVSGAIRMPLLGVG